MQVGVITNPNSRKNRMDPSRAQLLRDIVGDRGVVCETQSLDSIKPVLREFLRRRAKYWVADGGDGALHWMLRLGMEVLQEDEFAKGNYNLPLTLPTKGGTIDFVANNVGLQGDSQQILSDLTYVIDNQLLVEEAEVDTIGVSGVSIVNGVEVPFQTYGFAIAAAGIGQRFFSKYYQDQDPNPRTIVKVVAQALASMPVSFSPLRAVPGMPDSLKNYAQDLLAPMECTVSVDGMILPAKEFTGVHIASMSINLGNVFRLFNKADKRGQLHAIVGSPSPLSILRNLPRMTMGKDLRGRDILDRSCRELSMEATGSELLHPIIDGEVYSNVKKIRFELGPRISIPRLQNITVSAAA